MKRKNFKGEADTRNVGNRLWKLLSIIEYAPPGYNKVIVKEGFRTDYASVPRIFWIIMPPDGEYTLAAIVHDYLYHTQLRSRREADMIFLLAMRDLGVSWIKRHTMQKAVRIGGWIPWNKRAKEIQRIRKQLENDGVEDTEK